MSDANAGRLRKITFCETSTSLNNDNSLPNRIVLDDNYPNPFNPSTNISFYLPKAENISLKVYNMMGQEVRHLIQQHLPQGKHTVQFEAGELSSGMYIYRLRLDDHMESKTMTLIK